MPSRQKIERTVPELSAAMSAPPRPARNAGDTRARILAAARVRFSLDAYENVGTRDIAADAGVDAALVNRYFGGKEKLFDEAIVDAFAIKDHFAGIDMSTFGEVITTLVIEGSQERREARFDALGILLRGRDAELRAALIASYLIGLATMKHALGSPLLGDATRRKTVATIGAAIQACVDG